MGVEPATFLLQFKVILPWLHYTEVCPYGIGASSVFWDPGKGSFFNPMACGIWWWNLQPCFLWTRLILPWCVGMEVGPYTVGPPFMSTALLLDTNLLILVPVIAIRPYDLLFWGCSIVLSLRFRRSWAKVQSPLEEYFIINSSVPVLFILPVSGKSCVTYLLGAVIKLNRLHNYRAGSFL